MRPLFSLFCTCIGGAIGALYGHPYLGMIFGLGGSIILQIIFSQAFVECCTSVGCEICSESAECAVESFCCDDCGDCGNCDCGGCD